MCRYIIVPCTRDVQLWGVDHRAVPETGEEKGGGGWGCHALVEGGGDAIKKRLTGPASEDLEVEQQERQCYVCKGERQPLQRHVNPATGSVDQTRFKRYPQSSLQLLPKLSKALQRQVASAFVTSGE